MKIAKNCLCCDSSTLDRAGAVLMPFVAHRIFGWTPVEITPDWNMRDLAQGTAYSLCNTVHCPSCGFIFLDMRFDDEEMGALYGGYRDAGYSALRARYEPGYVQRNEILNEGSTYIGSFETLLEPYVGAAPRVLDWGGDSGINTPFRGKAARHDVYDISGKPLIEGAHAVAREDVRGENYDLIVFSNVLEHVSQPHETIAELVSFMLPSTHLFVEVPHEDIVRADATGGAWRQKRHWHEHINFFTDSAIDSLMQRNGLRILERRSQAVTAGGKGSHVFAIIAVLA